MMKQDEKKELLRRIEILEWERNALHKNYVNARKDTACELLNILLDEPYSAYIDSATVYEIARVVYGLKVEKGRVKK